MSKIYLKEGDEAVLVINGKEITVSKRTISPTDAEEIINESDKIFSNRKSLITLPPYTKLLRCI